MDITDDGIKGLCYDGQCKLLHTLKMKEANVTKIGVKLALEHLPELIQFEFPHSSVQILAELRRENLERGDFKTYQITKFDCDEIKNSSGNIVSYESGSLRLAAIICPFVTVVNIKLPIGLTDVELQGLLELKTLRELDISGDLLWDLEGGRITFDGGILPLLKACGNFLQQLALHELNICLNIRSIAAYCPHLEILTLDFNDSYSMASLEEGSLYREAKFKKLKKLYLESLGFPSVFSSEMLSFLFSSPDLKSLDVYFCDALTDDVLEEASLRHQFLNLERLKLFACDSVTKKGIDILMNESNPLREISIYGCEMITKEDYEGWGKKIKEENLNITSDFQLPI